MIEIEETDTRYYIKNSTIPGAGLGLFTKEKILKGDWIEVIGVLVKTSSIADKCTKYANRYKFAGTKKGYKIVPMGYAGIINHTDNPALRNMDLVFLPGLPKRSQHSSEIVYQATKDIEPNEELLGNYGADIGKQLDWETFVEYDLYDLKKLTSIL